MSYFSRLTDIVTCNLTEILARAEDPQQTLVDIVREMEQGLEGAQRSVTTARTNRAHLEKEMTDCQNQIATWTERAKAELAEGNEEQARLCLFRRQEVEALIAGLDQQLTAATATCQHLETTLHALQARLADARRRLAELRADPAAETPPGPVEGTKLQSVEEELAALKRELGQS